MIDKPKYNLETDQGEPVVYIQLFSGKRLINFEFNPSEYKIATAEGDEILQTVDKRRTWRVIVKESQPTKYEYFLNLKESLSLEPVKKQFDELSKNHQNLKVIGLGGEFYHNNVKINDNYIFRLVAGPFSSEEEIKKKCEICGSFTHCSVFRRLAEKGKGTLEVYDPEYRYTQEIEDEFELIPQIEGATFTLRDFTISTSNELGRPAKANLKYSGRLRIKIDQGKNVCGISSLPIEKYLMGVMASELEDPNDMEYVKCMAVLLRSNIIAGLGINHPGEPYDYCSESHCMRYYGRLEIPQLIEKAVDQTRGLVLEMAPHSICRAHYHYCCGGHTENARDVWLCNDYQYSTGKYDGETLTGNKFDLRKEKDARAWIDGQPETNCRSNPLPSGQVSNLAGDAYRWQEEYTGGKLRSILTEKLGEDPGAIYEIIPLQRGVSGRIKEVEMLAGKRNFKILGENNICQAFSINQLNSSCFYVKTELDQDSIPVHFTFVGAGKGHGVGLCKSGAIQMARSGRSIKDILKHYFENSKLIRIYH